MLVLVLEASDRINYVLFGGAYSRMTVSVVHARMVCDIVVIFSRSPEPGHKDDQERNEGRGN